MKKVIMQSGTKEMIRNHTKIRVEFKEGIPYATLYDSWSDELETVELDIESLEEAEKYPYYIEIDTFSYNAMRPMTFRRYHKTESAAVEDKEKFIVGDDYFDDVEIKAVKGPFKA